MVVYLFSSNIPDFAKCIEAENMAPIITFLSFNFFSNLYNLSFSIFSG